MPRTLSSSEYAELGKRYYALKEYQKALDAFTEGIEASTNTDISLFDYRAATWEKLANLQQALSDGRSMIKADKTNARGYLRTAQILQKMGKPDVALGIYEYGLRNVPLGNSVHLNVGDCHESKDRTQILSISFTYCIQNPGELECERYQEL
jgi:F-box/TPR repeat protein Pof3